MQASRVFSNDPTAAASEDIHAQLRSSQTKAKDLTAELAADAKSREETAKEIASAEQTGSLLTQQQTNAMQRSNKNGRQSVHAASLLANASTDVLVISNDEDTAGAGPTL